MSWEDEPDILHFEPRWPAGAEPIPGFPAVEVEGTRFYRRHIHALLQSPWRGAWFRAQGSRYHDPFSLRVWALWRRRSGALGVGPIGYVPHRVAVTLIELRRTHDLYACLVELRPHAERWNSSASIVVGWSLLPALQRSSSPAIDGLVP